ncbi:MAG: flagellar basal body rod protein FlgC [Phycisphaeraceae bacterium]|nr:flagellar basal body rod protein FlgC [Phycisphaeraceae bacterium]
MFGTLDISASALVAQKTRLQVISANLANQQAIEGPDGEHSPYQRRMVTFAVGDPGSGSGRGVHVRAIEMDESPPLMRFMPGHRFANEDGYVAFPNVDSTFELVDAMEATRAYEANITAAEATKTMFRNSLRILA